MTDFKKRLDELVKLRDARRPYDDEALALAEELHAEVERLTAPRPKWESIETAQKIHKDILVKNDAGMEWTSTWCNHSVGGYWLQVEGSGEPTYWASTNPYEELRTAADKMKESVLDVRLELIADGDCTSLKMARLLGNAITAYEQAIGGE